MFLEAVRTGPRDFRCGIRRADCCECISDLAHAQPRAPRPHGQALAGFPSECGRAGNDHDGNATVITLFTFGTARPSSGNRERAPSTRLSSERRHVPVVTPSSKIERKTSRRHSGDYTELRECFTERLLAS